MFRACMGCCADTSAGGDAPGEAAAAPEAGDEGPSSMEVDTASGAEAMAVDQAGADALTNGVAEPQEINVSEGDIKDAWIDAFQTFFQVCWQSFLCSSIYGMWTAPPPNRLALGMHDQGVSSIVNSLVGKTAIALIVCMDPAMQHLECRVSIRPCGPFWVGVHPAPSLGIVIADVQRTQCRPILG